MPEFGPHRTGGSLAIIILVEPVFPARDIDHLKAVERSNSFATLVVCTRANYHAKGIVLGGIISLYLLHGQCVPDRSCVGYCWQNDGSACIAEIGNMIGSSGKYIVGSRCGRGWPVVNAVAPATTLSHSDRVGLRWGSVPLSPAQSV